MKYLKGLIIIFLVTSVLAVSGVTAKFYQGYAGFNLGANKASVNAGTLQKDDYKKHVIGVISTKGTRDIQARFRGQNAVSTSSDVGYSNWILVEVPKNSSNSNYSVVKRISTETRTSAYGMAPGNVTLYLRTRNSYVGNTYFNGGWYVSETVYNKMNK